MASPENSTGKITTLTVKLGTQWSADIEIENSATLDEVHFAIQQAVDFDNDHLYEFYIARTERTGKKTTFDDENGTLFSTEIGEIFPLPRKHFLFYLFDYGDSWRFKILASRKKPHPPEAGVEYPRVVNETGEKPVQYWYREDDDDEE